MLLQDIIRATLHCGCNESCRFRGSHRLLSALEGLMNPASCRGHPNTSQYFGEVSFGGFPIPAIESTTSLPELSPACPRAFVIPPTNRNCPTASYSKTCPEVAIPNRCVMTHPTSSTTLTPGIRLACRHNAVRCQFVSTPSGCQKITFIRTDEPNRAARRSSSPIVAPEQGHWG